MVVASALAVAAALVLLVVGVTDAGLPAVYASIAFSCVAGALLIGAVYRRRGPHLPTTAPRPSPAERLPDDAAPDRGSAADGPVHAGAQQPSDGEPDARYSGLPADAADAEGLVWLAGSDDQQLFHDAACPRLVEPGRTPADPIPVDVVDAIDDGYRPCPQCEPGGGLVRP